MKKPHRSGAIRDLNSCLKVGLFLLLPVVVVMQPSAWALLSFAMPINEPPMSPAAEMSSRYPVRIRWFGCCWWSMICVWEVSDVCSSDDLKIAGMIGWGVDGDQGWPWCWSQVPVGKPLLAETSTTTLRHLYWYRPIGCYWKRVTTPTQHNKLNHIVPILNIKKLPPLSIVLSILNPLLTKKLLGWPNPRSRTLEKLNNMIQRSKADACSDLGNCAALISSKRRKLESKLWHWKLEVNT